MHLLPITRQLEDYLCKDVLDGADTPLIPCMHCSSVATSSSHITATTPPLC